MKRLWNHMRRLWPRYTLLPGIPLTLWALFMTWRGLARWDHFAVAIAVLVTAYTSEKTKRFLLAYAGFVGVAWSYDAMQFFREVGVSVDRVHLCDLYGIERTLFGFSTGVGRVTLQDWFLVHHHWFADALFAVPYGIYIFVAMGYGVYLYFVDHRACQRYSLAFFALNLLGFITYHVYPAAPPWYFHKYGCVVDIAASSSAGPALTRVDAMLGLHYFQGLYGRASEVFGAVPSLHVAYPLLIILDGWKRNGRMIKGVTVFYFLLTCCAAVYLDHHWILDLVLGWAYTLCVFYALRRLIPVNDGAAVRRSDPTLEPVPQELLSGRGGS